MMTKSGMTYVVANLIMLPIALAAVGVILVWAVGMAFCQLGVWAWHKLDEAARL